MNSLNHYAYGIIVEWIYERVCGLKIGENGAGPKLLKFEPQPDKRFSHVHATYESVAGAYEAGWEWNKDQIRFYFQVPFDCRAEVGIKIPMKEISQRNGNESDLWSGKLHDRRNCLLKGNGRRMKNLCMRSYQNPVITGMNPDPSICLSWWNRSIIYI